MATNQKIVNGKKVKVYSLVLITNEDKSQILLGLKKRGFGINKFNGFGGKLDDNESIEECASREVLEECSLVVKNLEKISIMVYDFKKYDFLMEVHLFTTNQYSGTPTESDEMRPKWFNISDGIPFNQMWIDDIFWFPYFLKGNHFNGYFLFENDDDIVYKCIFTVEKDKKIEPIYEEPKTIKL